MYTEREKKNVCACTAVNQYMQECVCVYLNSVMCGDVEKVKQVIGTFKFSYPRLTLKVGSTIKSDHIRRFPAHDFKQIGSTL